MSAGDCRKIDHVFNHIQNSRSLWGYRVRLFAFVESRWKNRVSACPVSITPRNPA